MNRLQKKCILGTVGIHLLLFLILIVGPAFFNQQPKLDNSQILDVIPSTLVDAAVNSGVANAHPPTPQPIATPTPPQPLQAIPLPPKIVQPPTPTPTPPQPTPSPSLLSQFEKYFTSKPTPPKVTPDMTQTERPSKPHDDIKINTQMVKRTAVKNTQTTDNQNNARAINTTLKSLSKELSSATKIDMSGSSSASYANYATVVKSVYDRAILSNLPNSLGQNSENTKVTITISSDGTVVSSTIVSPSGDPAWDDAVQRTLDQVTFIAPFPAGTTDKERHYTIDFNPQVERELQ